MKKLLLALFSLISIVSFSQTTGYLRYDTVRVQRGGGNSTLVIENATRGLTGGFLQNYSEGRTKFAYALDSVWVDGDSLRFRYGLTTIAVLAPGGGPYFGFFNDETNSGGATTKDGNGEDYTITGVDTFSLSGNSIFLSPVDSLMFENIPVDGEGETELEITNLIGITATGKIKQVPDYFGRFGTEGDSSATENRSFNLNDNRLQITASEDDNAINFILDPYQIDLNSAYLDGTVRLLFENGEIGSLHGETPGGNSGFFVDIEDTDNPLVSVSSIGNINIAADGTGRQIVLNSPTLYFRFANPTINSGHFIIDNTFQQGTASHVLVYDSSNSEVKYVSIDSIGGSGSGDNIYTANGTLTGNRTLAGGDNSLTFNGLSSFSARATGASVSQIFFDGSGTAIWEPFGTAYVGVSDQRVDIQANGVYVTSLASNGPGRVIVDDDGKLIWDSDSGGGGGDGIDEVIAGYGLVNVNDSTLRIDTTGDFEDWVESKVTANLIVQSKGTGKNIWNASGDTLYMHRLDEGYGINITKSSDSTNVIGADTTQLATRDYVIDQISQIPTGGGAADVTDSIQVVDNYSDMTGNIAMDTVRKRIVYRIGNTFRWTAYTDSAFVLTQLSTPGSFTSPSHDDDQIDLSWSDVSNETGYEIYRNTVNTFGTATLITTTAANATTYTSGSLTASTTYYYWIIAVGDGVTYSNSNSATTSATTDAGLDSDASAYLARVAAHGVTVTTPQQTAVNQLFLDLKSYSIYSLYYDINLYIWGNADANAEPLKAVAPDITWVNSPTHGSTGVVMGATSYGNLGVAPSALTLNDSHLFFYTTSTSTASVVDMGSRGSTSTVRFDALARTSNSLTGEMNSNTAGTGQVAGTVTDASGMSMISRTSSTDLRAYRNGTQVGSTSTTTNNGTMPTVNMFIGAVNNNGSASLHTSRTYLASGYGAGMNSTQAANHNTAFATLFTALGF